MTSDPPREQASGSPPPEPLTYQVWMSAFGGRFREARLRAGLTQDNVAALLRGSTGEGQAYVSKIELGKANLTAKTMFRLAEIVGVKPDQLIWPIVPRNTPIR